MILRLQKITAWLICLIFLIGIIFAGDSNVLCISDNGLFKFEISCLPYCGDAEKTCETDVSGELQNESNDGSDCSDVELDGPLWSKRNQHIDSKHLADFVSAFNQDTHLSLISSKNDNSRIIKFHLAFGQSPPSYSITTTVLRC